MISLRLLHLTAANFFGDMKKGLTGAYDRFVIINYEL